MARPRSPERAVRAPRAPRPLAAAFELLGHRWALRVVWELRAGGCTFRELRTRCDDVSPTSLNARLAELRDAEIVESEGGDGYRLTTLGAELADALAPLADWSKRWTRATG